MRKSLGATITALPPYGAVRERGLADGSADEVRRRRPPARRFPRAGSAAEQRRPRGGDRSRRPGGGAEGAEGCAGAWPDSHRDQCDRADRVQVRQRLGEPLEVVLFRCVSELWEPVLAGSGVEVDGGGIDERLFSTIDRPEGEQVTLKGWPLYYFKDD